MPEPTPRRRRSAEESRVRILEAAQKRLVEDGPDGLRLQELAGDLGLSHPAILHHFGSREGLMQALATHGVQALNREIAERVQEEAVDLRGILDLTAETLANRGQARLLAWLVLSGRTTGAGPPRALLPLAEVAHAARREHREEAGRPEPAYEDTAFLISLVGLALLGDALFGDVIRQSVGLEGPDSADRFRTWMTEVLESHLSDSSTS